MTTPTAPRFAADAPEHCTACGIAHPPGAHQKIQSAPPDRLDHHEKMRIRAAAFRATRVYPGPVGELISRELLTWEEFGFRFDQRGLVARLVGHVLTASLPTAEHQR